MNDIPVNSVALNPKDRLDAELLSLALTSSSEPTSFEIQFTLNGSKFRYGVEYNLDAIIAE